MEFKRALITGISGSGGSYLAEYICENQPQVELHGLSRWHSTTSSDNLHNVRDKVTVHECDLNDFSSTFTAIQNAKPDVIFHLAAHANVKASFTTPLAVLQNNIMGTANLYEAIRLADCDPVVQLCSTSEVYGQVLPEEVPITEENPQRPSSPYAVSKTAQDQLGYTYFRSYDMKVIRTRMFAYLNPRRTDLFATAFTRQVARIEAGLQDELLHGNLESVRTILDVRDAMESYWVAAMKCEPGEVYNIGGTKSLKVGEYLDILKSLASKPIKSRVNPDLLRPADVTLQIPKTDKFFEATGWQPKYDFESSVEYMLNYWRNRVELLGPRA